MSKRIVRFTLELDLTEGIHFSDMLPEVSDKRIIEEAEAYLYPFLKDQIAGGEIKDWMQVKLVVKQVDGD